jgi:UDP-4-amino-4-deoxy-L-arabinose formyltransferase/UDP-glucuronic acid dehydrogenase (UDP-4-keto-hexauronic acid decarboxylating)
MRVAAIGRTQWLYDSIRACVKAGHQIVLIGTSPAEFEYSKIQEDFKVLAEELKCPFFCNKLINSPEYIQMVRQSGAEIAISVNWQTMIVQEFLKQFKYGVINAHAGDLPRFKGNACPNWAILSAEEKVVLTLHFMDVTLDGGPILLQREFPLRCDTYISEVYQFMSKNIPPMFVEVLGGLASGTIVPRPQPNDPALWLRCFPRLPQDGEVDWNRSAIELYRLVRANAEPFNGAYSSIGNEKIIIWRAHPEKLAYSYLGVPGQVVEIRHKIGSVAVLTGEGVLVLEEIEMASGGRCPASDLIKSTRIRLGLDLAQALMRLDDRVTQLEGRLNQILKKNDD